MFASSLKMQYCTTQKGRTYIPFPKDWWAHFRRFEQARKKMHKDAKDKQAKNTDSVCAVYNGRFFGLPYTCATGSAAWRFVGMHTITWTPLNFIFVSLVTMSSRKNTLWFKSNCYYQAELKKKKHDEEVKEDWVQCNKCNKWVHQICGLYNPKLDKGRKDSAKNNWESRRGGQSKTAAWEIRVLLHTACWLKWRRKADSSSTAVPKPSNLPLICKD